MAAQTIYLRAKNGLWEEAGGIGGSGRDEQKTKKLIINKNHQLTHMNKRYAKGRTINEIKDAQHQYACRHAKQVAKNNINEITPFGKKSKSEAIAEIMEAQHQQASKNGDLRGKNGKKAIASKEVVAKKEVAVERTFKQMVEQMVLNERVAALDKMVSRGSEETKRWLAPKEIKLGWPLTVLRYSGDNPGTIFGRVQKMVDLSCETMDCVSLKSNDLDRILREIAINKLQLEHEAVDVKRLKELVAEWHGQKGVTILFVGNDGKLGNKAAKLIFCIRRLSHKDGQEDEQAAMQDE